MLTVEQQFATQIIKTKNEQWIRRQ